MERFVIRQNIDRYRRMLEQAGDEATRLQISRLLKEEEEEEKRGSWFRNSLHSCRDSFKRISEPNDTGMLNLRVSFESGVRSRASRGLKRTSDQGNL